MRCRAAVLGIMLLSLLLRLLFLFSASSPEVMKEADDGLYYSAALQIESYIAHSGDLVREFLSGNLFHQNGLLQKYGLEIPWGALRRGPVYSAFAAAIFYLTGSHHVFWVYAAQALLATLSVAFFFGIANDLAGPAAGMISALIYAFYLPFFFIGIRFMQETLTLFLLLWFYYLLFRVIKKPSYIWQFGLLGILLFIIALTKSGIIFLPLFLVALLMFYAFKKNPVVSMNKVGILLLSFLIPYGAWSATISYQFHRFLLTAGLDKPGFSILAEFMPAFGGWIPDMIYQEYLDPQAVKIFKKEGFNIQDPGAQNVFPADADLIRRIRHYYLHEPLRVGRMFSEKFRRLWWEPFGWPWGNVYFKLSPVRWLHRILLGTALLGICVCWFEKRILTGLLLIPPIYGTVIHLMSHVENRYALIYFPFLIIFSGFFLQYAWQRRSILSAAFSRRLALPGIVLFSALIYHISDARLLWPLLSTHSYEIVRTIVIFLKSVAVILGFAAFSFWIKPILPSKSFKLALSLGCLLFLIPFETYAMTNTEWGQWSATIRNENQIFRQEIFLPRGSLQGIKAQRLRVDLELFSTLDDIVIIINGKPLAQADSLKTSERKFPIEAYSDWLRFVKKQAFEMRQWHTIEIPDALLKDGDFNVIDISMSGYPPDAGKSILSWRLYGDYALASTPNIFKGPYLHHYGSETSIFKLSEENDFRLNGMTLLYHKGVRSSFFDGVRWHEKDLSPEPGLQRGQYRVRIEIQDERGEFLVY